MDTTPPAAAGTGSTSAGTNVSTAAAGTNVRAGTAGTNVGTAAAGTNVRAGTTAAGTGTVSTGSGVIQMLREVSSTATSGVATSDTSGGVSECVCVFQEDQGSLHHPSPVMMTKVRAVDILRGAHVSE